MNHFQEINEAFSRVPWSMVCGRPWDLGLGGRLILILRESGICPRRLTVILGKSGMCSGRLTLILTNHSLRPGNHHPRAICGLPGTTHPDSQVSVETCCCLLLPFLKLLPYRKSLQEIPIGNPHTKSMNFKKNAGLPPIVTSTPAGRNRHTGGT